MGRAFGKPPGTLADLRESPYPDRFRDHDLCPCLAGRARHEVPPAPLESPGTGQFPAEPFHGGPVLFIEMHSRQPGRRPGRDAGNPCQMQLSSGGATDPHGFSRRRAFQVRANRHGEFFIRRGPFSPGSPGLPGTLRLSPGGRPGIVRRHAQPRRYIHDNFGCLSAPPARRAWIKGATGPGGADSSPPGSDGGGIL